MGLQIDHKSSSGRLCGCPRRLQGSEDGKVGASAVLARQTKGFLSEITVSLFIELSFVITRLWLENTNVERVFEINSRSQRIDFAVAPWGDSRHPPDGGAQRCTRHPTTRARSAGDFQTGWFGQPFRYLEFYKDQQWTTKRYRIGPRGDRVCCSVRF